MHIIHESTIKQENGIVEVSVYIVNEKTAKHYTYGLQSDWAAEQFHKFYRKGRKFHGRALQYLKKFQIKEKENESKRPSGA
jgi:hypothetical protein